MADEENQHRRWLIDLFRQKFGDHIPLIRRQDVSGLVRHDPIWTVRPLGLEKVRQQAEAIETETRNFYRSALERASDAEIRKLLGDLIAAEDQHVDRASAIGEGTDERSKSCGSASGTPGFRPPVRAAWLDRLDRRLGFDAGPIFAAAFATHNTWQTFLVGLAASVGAGISMAFAEALADDGQISGRGSPWIRGGVTGLMTALGGLGHTLPYLISDFWTATTSPSPSFSWNCGSSPAYAPDSWIPNFFRAALEVVVGGSIVFAVGVLIGNA